MNKYDQLGRYFVHRDKLKNNLLSIKSEKKTVLSPMPKILTISDKLKEMISIAIGEKRSDPIIFGLLDDSDKKLYMKVMKLCMISNIEPYRIDYTNTEKEALQNKLDLLVGELEAGNDNEEVAKRIIKLIVQMYKDGFISNYKAFDFLVANDLI